MVAFVVGDVALEPRDYVLARAPARVGAAQLVPGRAPAAAQRQARPGPMLRDCMRVFSIPLTTRFRGITVREGVLVRASRLGRVQPVPGVRRRDVRALAGLCARGGRRRLASAVALRHPGQRDRPGVLPGTGARDRARLAGCRTAKVKVAEPGQQPAEDEARLEAVRDALGPDGLVRIDANGGWSVDEAVARIPLLERAAGGLEYVEQPVASVEDLAVSGGGSRCRSRPTSRSAGPPTPIGCAISRRPTSPCSRCSRWAAYAPACGSPRTSGCRSWCPARSSRASASRPGVALAAALPELPLRVRAGHGAAAHRRRGRRTVAAGRRRAARRRPDGGSVAMDQLAASPDRVEHWRRRMAEVEAVRQDRRS